MFGPPGQTYLYYIYGMHWMLNLVTEREGFPAAVLLRALEPLEGQEKMRILRTSKRGKVLKDRELTNGPARLTQALALDKTFNAFDLTRGEGLWLEEGFSFPAGAIQTGHRIGIGYAAPADQLVPWRFWLRNNPFVSR
jgi:DNA-3-methyladenine glycosylase